MYISGKDRLGYINEDLEPPEETDSTFRKWRTENAMVKSWLINSMDPKLIGNYIRFTTAKAIWDAIAMTYFDGGDTSQVYDLKRKVMKLKQGGGSIETYFNHLQGLWREINFRRPNPMKCQFDIEKYISILQEDRVYTFLDGLDDRLDKIRGDVLQLKPFPTVEEEYALVRQKDLRQSVMLTKEDISSAAMISRTGQGSQRQVSFQPMINGKNNTPKQKQQEGRGGTHCGNPKHTTETCFQLNGTPDWWYELKKKRKQEAGRAHWQSSLANTGENSERAESWTLIPQPANTSPASVNNSMAHNDLGNHGWIIDSGATNHMTFDSRDLVDSTQPRRAHA